MGSNLEHAYYVLHLIVLLLNKEKEAVTCTDISDITETARRHSLEAITIDALEFQGIKSDTGTVRKAKAQRRSVLLFAQLKEVVDKLNEREIRHMPLKGAILKEYYPHAYQREMKDIDILCDPGCREQVREVMESSGFTAVSYREKNDDVYFKAPFFNFEMHFQLFDLKPKRAFFEYYESPFDRLQKTSDCGYGFTEEDFYIYMILHTYKHYIGAGVGFRYLLDTYFYLRQSGSELNWSYITDELKKLGVADFENTHRSLANKVFSGQQLTDHEEKALNEYLLYGVHGTRKNAVHNEMQQQSGSHKRTKYVLGRMFPYGDDLPQGYRFFRKHKAFLPALWIFRPVKALFTHPKDVAQELKDIQKDQS